MPSTLDTKIALKVAYFFQDRMAKRVAAKFSFTAGLNEELVAKFDKLFQDFSGDAALEVANWFKNTFRFDVSKTPQGQRDLKLKAEKLHWWLTQSASLKSRFNGQGVQFSNEEDTPDLAWARGGKEAKRVWEEEVQPLAGDLIRYFSNEGSKIVPKEVQVGGNTYLNFVGFDQKKIGQYVTAMEAVFGDVKGWRRKAFAGGLTVAFAGPKDFRGTAAGKYKSDQDILYVRATPNVLKRAGGSYGALDYILIHELGHRYERKVGTKFDFERQEWWTSPYSKKDGEQFAELFAISNFDLKGPWNQEVVAKFDSLMG